MKFLYVSTISNTINAFMIPHIRFLIEQGHTVDIACNIVNDIDSELFTLGCEIYNVEFNRSPTRIENFIAYKRIKKIIESSSYDIIHTHTPIASALIRLACKKKGSPKVIYTAHGYHFYKNAPLKNWITYFPLEKLLSNYTDVLVTINKEDYLLSKNRFNAAKILYIPGVGVDTKRIDSIVVDRKEKRNELGIPENAVLILSVGELNSNKNHEVAIRAIAELNNKDVFYIICGKGSLDSYLNELIFNLNVQNNIKLVGFRKDVLELYKISDIFLFPSIREGLPMSIMEAMSSKLPIICSSIRGNSDLINDRENGYLVPNRDSLESYKNSLMKLVNNEDLRIRFGEKNREKIEEFSKEKVLESLYKAYLPFIDAENFKSNDLEESAK